ncbi:threonine/serine exporter family protein [Treponema phagedenis]|uniref:threonine/serine ThrE exporter family protein n=1 Tax=Treponema phagedenis TaxID=162 RepID=UPI0001F63AF1|nr:threonine/serine exporter family protein [Treponema phagedenis]EFW38745.1 hypothetical protein HMPREF9554_00755 [Treponema phagedenis F0421]TYT79202.1 threonine/serine exporter family protein [Treponema phagedenis]
MDIQIIADTALNAGAQVLINGGETYRAEETMSFIAQALGAENISSFVTPTIVMISCTSQAGVRNTSIKRIKRRETNLNRLSLVNDFSRKISSKQLLGSEAITGIKEISESPGYSAYAVIFFAAVSAFCFSLMFKGCLKEALISFVLGAIMKSCLFFAAPLALPEFMLCILGAAITSTLSGVAVALGLVQGFGNINIAVLMALVPGVAIVNAIRDCIAGDFMAGNARILEAFMIAAGLSIGASVGLLLFPISGGYQSALLIWEDPLPAFCLSAIAVAAFSYLFNVSKKDIPWAALIGGAGWVIYIILRNDYVSAISAYIIGAFIIGLISEIFAVALKRPATVFIIPGIIPFVPGGGMYETMLYAVLNNQKDFTSTGFATLLGAGGIALGIALASVFARLYSKIRKQYKRWFYRSSSGSS